MRKGWPRGPVTRVRSGLTSAEVLFHERRVRDSRARAALGTRTSGVLRASDASLVVYECVGERSNSARRLRLVQQAAFER